MDPTTHLKSLPRCNLITLLLNLLASSLTSPLIVLDPSHASPVYVLNGPALLPLPSLLQCPSPCVCSCAYTPPQAIHSCAHKFPDVAGTVEHLLMDFLGDNNTASALDVIFFVREIMETNERLRPSILERLRDTFTQIRWEYATHPCRSSGYAYWSPTRHVRKLSRNPYLQIVCTCLRVCASCDASSSPDRVSPSHVQSSNTWWCQDVG